MDGFKSCKPEADIVLGHGWWMVGYYRLGRREENMKREDAERGVVDNCFSGCLSGKFAEGNR